MRRHDMQLGTYERSDGERFQITAQLFETPTTFDYWIAVYEVHHEAWERSHYKLNVPKKGDQAGESALQAN